MKIKNSDLTLLLLFNFVCLQLIAQESNTFHLPREAQDADQASQKRADADRMLFEKTKAEAEKGEAQAQCNLGHMFQFSEHGVTNNAIESVKWYQKAANQNYTQAQFWLGVCYAAGFGVEKDDTEAAKWYRKSAEQNYAQAQFWLGDFYASGRGVEKDYWEAMKWYRKAAEQNNGDAQLQLGANYEKGEGVIKDDVEAYKWLLLAASHGNEDAKYYVAQSEMRLTREQIAEGQKLAREFKPQTKYSSNTLTSPDNPTASGTGFFITDDGYLISNYHVVKEATKIRLVTSAGTIDAKVFQVDAANDLALLKAVGKFSPLPIAASRSAHLGGTVATIGFPDPSLQGFSPKLAKGEIASLSGAGDDPRYFQISVPVQPGNSGGALVDERGNVIGIVSAKLDASTALAMSGSLPENVNYAVKSSLLLSFLESVPEVAAKLKPANTVDEKFEDVVKSAQGAAVLVLVY